MPGEKCIYTGYLRTMTDYCSLSCHRDRTFDEILKVSFCTYIGQTLLHLCFILNSNQHRASSLGMQIS